MEDIIKKGDTVKVKNGQKDPDFEMELMDGWQGQVIEINKDGLLEIKLDAQTLLDTSLEYLVKIIQGGYDYEIMNLGMSDVEKVSVKDASRESDAVEAAANLRIYWVQLFEERAEKYMKIFDGIDVNDGFDLIEKWEEYLNENLTFPFEATVTDSEGRLRVGDKLKISAISEYEDHYGFLVIGRQGREKFVCALCDLEATDKSSANYQLVEDCNNWHANGV